MTKFVYEVAGWEFEDTEAFGLAWKQAKNKAAERHAAIYRTVIKNEKVVHEVYTSARCFLSITHAKPNDVMRF